MNTSSLSRSEEGASGAPPAVTLRRRRGAPRHPWIYRRMIRHVPRGLEPGAEVRVVNGAGEAVGRGFYNGRSMIAVRLLSRDPESPLDAEFFRKRLSEALALRREILGLERETDAYRVAHSEADGLSGCVVDRYGDCVVAEFFSLGLYLRRGTIRAVLQELFPGARVFVRADREAARREGIDPDPAEERALAAAGEVEIREGKMRLLVHPGGHKTGYFLDQRENRKRFAALVRGRKVLDAFCYTGAFAIAARTLGKAQRVVAVDLDEEALALARENARRNRAEIEWVHADVLPYLRNQRHAVEPFDAMVLDPPKWIGSRDETEAGERRYLDLNTYAFQAVRRGGVVLTCSCSGRIAGPAFLGLLERAAARAGRDLQVFAVAGAAPDHPVLLSSPETEYLTAVFARVV